MGSPPLCRISETLPLLFPLSLVSRLSLLSFSLYRLVTCSPLPRAARLCVPLRWCLRDAHRELGEHPVSCAWHSRKNARRSRWINSKAHSNSPLSCFRSTTPTSP